jgi:hypothetical protein
MTHGYRTSSTWIITSLTGHRVSAAPTGIDIVSAVAVLAVGWIVCGYVLSEADIRALRFVLDCNGDVIGVIECRVSRGRDTRDGAVLGNFR